MMRGRLSGGTSSGQAIGSFAFRSPSPFGDALLVHQLAGRADAGAADGGLAVRHGRRADAGRGGRANTGVKLDHVEVSRACPEVLVLEDDVAGTGVHAERLGVPAPVAV